MGVRLRMRVGVLRAGGTGGLGRERHAEQAGGVQRRAAGATDRQRTDHSVHGTVRDGRRQQAGIAGGRRVRGRVDENGGLRRRRVGRGGKGR